MPGDGYSLFHQSLNASVIFKEVEIIPRKKDGNLRQAAVWLRPENDSFFTGRPPAGVNHVIAPDQLSSVRLYQIPNTSRMV